MTDVVAVLLVELVVTYASAEALAPEHERLVDAQPNALEEQAVLQTAKVLQVVVRLQVIVQITHAHWEMELGEHVDHVCCDLAVAVERRGVERFRG